MTQLLKDLTHEVNADPNFVLPEGFVRVRADKIKEEYEPDKKKYPRESEQVAIKVLDELVTELFDIHIVEPVIKYEKFFIVKPSNALPGPIPQKPKRTLSQMKKSKADFNHQPSGANGSIPKNSPSPRKNNYLQSNRYQPPKVTQASELSDPSHYGPGYIRDTEPGSEPPSRYQQMQRNRNLITDTDVNSESALYGHHKPHY